MEKTHLTDRDINLIKAYKHLPLEDQRMVDIILKIGASKILTHDEFHMLIQNLMNVSD